MSHQNCLAVALLLSCLAACGGKASSAPNGDDPVAGTGQGGSSAGASHGGSGGTSHGGSASAGTASGGSGHAGNAGAAGAAACEAFDDEGGLIVNVTITNKTAAPIYLGQSTVTCGVSPLFYVADVDGTSLPDLGDCRNACVTLRQQGAGGCPAICRFPSAVALQPGEVVYTTWNGLFSKQGQLSNKCLPFDAGSVNVTCDQAKRIQPGTFTFSAHAGSAIDCSQTGGTCSACSPAPSGNGGCTTQGSLIAGKMLSTETTVSLDGTYGVFPSVQAGPSNGAGDASGSGAALIRSVDLVFTE